MRRLAITILLLVAALLSGCTDRAEPAADPQVQPGSQYQSTVLNLSVPVMPREAPAPGERTLEAAPQWRLGEWWTYTMTDGFTGTSYEFTRVVAGEDRQAGNYLVGFPVDSFSNDVMLFHMPGYGDIVKSNLAYETHDAYFQPLDFPLTQGHQWDMSFEGVANGVAEVVSAADGKARIEMAVSVYGSIVAEYDADIGEITSLSVGNGSYAQYTLTGHGYGYEGVVRVPHAHDLVFNHGRFAGVVATSPFGPAPPADLVTVEPGYDRLSFIIAVGGGATFLGAPATVGVFRTTVTAPDGTVYEVTWTPADAAAGRDLIIEAIGHEEPEGQWRFDHLAGGGGVSFVEGIGYHSIDVDLPSGCVIASFNAQHHNADCKVSGGQLVAGNATKDA